MSLFGEIDISEIEQELPRGKYPLVVDFTSGPHKPSEDNENDNINPHQQFYKVTLAVDPEENEEFGGTRLEPLFINAYPELKKSDLEKFSQEDRARFNQAVRWLRHFLFACGVSEDEMQAKEFDFDEIKGSKLWGECFTDKKNKNFRVQTKSLNQRFDSESGGDEDLSGLDVFK